MTISSDAGQWPKGSEWRKWDMHIHSPASHGFAGDWNQFVIQLGNADCDVIGINDYFSVAGYKEIVGRLQDRGAATEGTHYDTQHFSFLTKERFHERNGRIAKDFGQNVLQQAEAPSAEWTGAS